MRLAIIDDERIIREGLQKYISKSDLGFDEVYAYESGIEALKASESILPDVIIADILMPEMDGLETVEQFFQMLPGVQVIVVSGCCDFEYVRKSLNYPVIDYIPKPVNLTHLKAALNLAVRRVEKIRRVQSEQMQSKRILSMLDYLREQFMRTVLKGGYSDVKLIQQGMDRLDIDPFAQGGCVIAVLRQRREWSENDSFDSASLLMGTVARRFSENLTIPMDEKHLCVLFPIRDTSEYAACVETLEMALREILSQDGMILSAGLSRFVSDAGTLSRAYREASDAMQLACMEKRSLMLANDAQISDNAQSYFIGEDMEHMLRVAIVTSNEAQLEYLMDFFRETLARSRDIDILWHARLEFIRVYVNLLHALDDQSQMGMLSDLGSVQAMKDIGELLDWFRKRMLILLNRSEVNRSSRAQKISDYMLREIETNFDKPLSLQTFSDQTGLSTNYLSQIFKKHTGISFIRFLTDRRMERAVQLLRESHMNVSQIATTVGYDDPTYFMRLFRKRYDCSPGEFRGKDM